ncbi:MAG: cell division protein FtsA [Bacteroidaceae bacterium]|nr:cell division protein FtsA [Bacteroidaceae bacterium]
METEKLIVAIELGSSKISGVAGQILYDGTLKVMAYAYTPSSSCIRHGAVYNLDKTANAIAEVISRLDSMLSAKINKVYIGYSSKSLRSEINTVERTFTAETVISQEIIDSMFSECEMMERPGYQILLQESLEYVVDHKRGTETDPMGVACTSLQGSYLSILLKKQISDYMAQCFSTAGITILDGFVTPVVEADAILSAEEKHQGCAFVDYGADTTTVSVYKNGLLRYLRVIPLGSTLITRDLATVLKIDEDQAEKLKCTYGLCTLIGGQDMEETVDAGGHKVTLKEIGGIIEARNEEIVKNVSAVIKASGYYDVLYSGLIVTGGGSKLRQLDKVFYSVMPDLRTPRFVVEPSFGVNWNESLWNRGDGSQVSLLSVMAKGSENCCEAPVMDRIDNVSPADLDRMEMNQLFNSEGESAQADRDREQLLKKDSPESVKKDSSDKADAAKEKESGGKKRRNYFRRIIDNIMNTGEKFFDSDQDFKS